jgi:hypothetical protein
MKNAYSKPEIDELYTEFPNSTPLWRAIVSFLIILMLSLSIMLLSNKCSNTQDSFDWSKQPYQNIVPPVVGKWFDPNVSVRIDPAVYPASGDVTPIPAYIKDLCAKDTQDISTGVFSYCKDFGLNFSPSETNPEVVIKFYYGPWATKGVKGIEGGVRDVVIVREKSTSVNEAPTRENNYNGLTYVNAKSKHYVSVIVWINVYIYEDYRIQCLNNPSLDFKTLSKNAISQIEWHEFFHVVGLNDDRVGTIPGLMVYKVMKTRPSDAERGVCEWLY